MAGSLHIHRSLRGTEKQLCYNDMSKCLTPRTYLFSYKSNIPYLHSLSVVNSLSFPYSNDISLFKESSVIHALKNCEKVFLNFRLCFLQRVIPSAMCESHYSNSLHISEIDHMSSSIESGEEEEGLPGVRYQRPKTSSTPSNRHIGEVELNSWLEKETGMDRLRMMYSIGSDGNFLQEDTQVVNTMFHRTVVLGFFLNVFVAARKDANNKKEVSTQALAGAMNPRSGFKVILAEAVFNTVRLTVFAGCLMHLSQAIAAYRNKTSVWEYTFSSALAFGFLALGKGVKSVATGTVGGAAFGTVMGLAMCHVLTSNGVTQEQRHAARIEQFLREQRSCIEQQTQLDLSSEQDRFK